jgi:hypothetical protein
MVAASEWGGLKLGVWDWEYGIGSMGFHERRIADGGSG